MGLPTPKQFCTILNRPLISYTIKAFERMWPKVSLVRCHHCKISDATQSVLPRHQTLPCDQTAPLQLHTVCTFKTRSLLFSFQPPGSSPYPDQMLTAVTQIQSVSRSDGASAPRDDLYSPECQWRPCQLDELQRQIPSEDLVGHRDKTTRTRLSWIGTVVIVVAKENHDLMLNIVQKYNHTKVKVVHGGTARHKSIFSGLQAFSSTTDSLTPNPKMVIIHDGVRPFVEEDLLLKITLAAKEQGASGAIRPLVSTVIATTSEGYLDHSLERAKYRASEMPQGFLYDIIFQAYQRCSEFDFEFGTECLHLALQYCGTNAKLIEGPPTLWKVTYKRDLAAAEAIIKETLLMSACILTGAEAEAIELAKTLQKNLNMALCAGSPSSFVPVRSSSSSTCPPLDNVANMRAPSVPYGRLVPDVAAPPGAGRGQFSRAVPATRGR